MTSNSGTEPNVDNGAINTTPPPNHIVPSDCLFFPYASTIIDAPASHVAHCILNSSRYPEWNTFVPKVTVSYDPGPAAGATDETAHEAFLKVGTKMSFQCEMKGPNGGSTFDSGEEVTVVEMPPLPSSSSTDDDRVYVIRWHSRAIPSFLLRSERFHNLRVVAPSELVEGGGAGAQRMERCEYRTWETFAGPLAWLVRYMHGELLGERFVDWARDLKQFAEKTWAEREH